MKAITVSALLLIASLSQADAQRNRRVPCFATVCVINNLPPRDRVVRPRWVHHELAWLAL